MGRHDIKGIAVIAAWVEWKKANPASFGPLDSTATPEVYLDLRLERAFVAGVEAGARIVLDEDKEIR